MTMRTLAFAAATAALMMPAAVQGQNWRTVTMSRQLEDNDGVEVEVEYGAGEITLRSVDGGLLYRMNLEYDEDRYEPVAEFSGNDLRLGVESIGRSVSMRGRKAGSLELELARGVPMDLDLELGAVKADIDLGGLALIDLELSAGASESVIDVSEPNPIMLEEASFEAGVSDFTVLNLGNLNAEEIEVDAGVGSITLDFSGRWERDARVSIDMGLGSLELRVPEGLGVELRKDSFLASFDSEGLIKRGDVYVSPDFEDADYRIVIDLDAAFGSVSIVWVR
jgi:uncharacterized protein DUF2154